jgi:hypothetical protein
LVDKLTSTGLYAGLLPKLLQSVLTAAFMFVAQRRIYEAVKKVRLGNVYPCGLPTRGRRGLAIYNTDGKRRRDWPPALNTPGRDRARYGGIGRLMDRWSSLPPPSASLLLDRSATTYLFFW